MPFTAAVPFEEQPVRWSRDQFEKYKELLGHASEIVHVCEPGYAAWKLQKRNEWMVDRCDLLLAVWDGSNGGTANCVRYAEKIGRPLVRINPRHLAMQVG